MNVKKLLIFFLANAPKSLGRTDLVKYTYLFEYYYFQMVGKQYTSLEFRRDHYGPNQVDIVEFTRELSHQGIISINEYENRFGRTSYNHSLISDNIVGYELGETEKEIANYVVGVLGNENYRGVIGITYDTPPMKEILKEEEEKGFKVSGRVIDMSTTKAIFKSSRQAREEARERIEAKPKNEGSDSEYYANLLEQYHNYEDTRRRAHIAER